MQVNNFVMGINNTLAHGIPVATILCSLMQGGKLSWWSYWPSPGFVRSACRVSGSVVLGQPRHLNTVWLWVEVCMHGLNCWDIDVHLQDVAIQFPPLASEHCHHLLFLAVCVEGSIGDLLRLHYPKQWSQLPSTTSYLVFCRCITVSVQ